MVSRNLQRPGREWKEHDKVCPRKLAWNGTFVEGKIVRVIDLQGNDYTPPASYEWQLYAYIVEWSAPIALAPLSRGSGIFFGNDLLTWEEGVKGAIRVQKEMEQRALDRLGSRRKICELEFQLDRMERNKPADEEKEDSA